MALSISLIKHQKSCARKRIVVASLLDCKLLPQPSIVIRLVSVPHYLYGIARCDQVLEKGRFCIQDCIREVIFKMHELPSNVHYQSDLNNILRLTRNILFTLGVWPSSGRKRFTSEKIGKFLRIFVSYALLLFSLVPGALFWIFKMKARARFRATTIMLYGFMTMAKYYNLIIRQDQIRCCLKYLEEDWKDIDNANTRNAMLESARTGKRLVTICAIFLYSSGLSLRTLIPLSRGKIVTPQNITIRPLPYPTYLFTFDVQSSPIYEIVFAIHCLSGVVTISISTGLYGLIIVFVHHACGQLKVLVDLINGLVVGQKRDELEVNKKLAVIVDHQTRIRR